jgi:hypothetical protein
MSKPDPKSEQDRFKELTKKLLKVPKSEVDEARRKELERKREGVKEA